MKKYILLTVALQLFCSCGMDNSKVESLNWKDRGDHYNIENDTIYKDNLPIAIKVTAIQRFDNSQVLIIKKIDKNKTGRYHAK